MSSGLLLGYLSGRKSLFPFGLFEPLIQTKAWTFSVRVAKKTPKNKQNERKPNQSKTKQNTHKEKKNQKNKETNKTRKKTYKAQKVTKPQTHTKKSNATDASVSKSPDLDY